MDLLEKGYGDNILIILIYYVLFEKYILYCVL